MVDVLQFIEQTNNARTEEEAFAYLVGALDSLGLDRVIYSLITDHPSIGMKQGHGILRNYPEYWMDHYTEKDYFDIDPSIKQIRLIDGVFRWFDLEQTLQRKLSRSEDLLMHEADEAKLKDGLGLGLHSPAGEILGMGFASSHGGVELNSTTRSLVYLLATQFHNVFKALARSKYPVEVIDLSEREKEILTWCAMGKTAWETGEILHISERTVRFHLTNCFRKLDTVNAAQAVFKALRLRLITP